MTGYTVHTGSTEQFSEGWDRIFGNAAGNPRKTTAKNSAGTTKSAKKKRAKPAAAKKKS